MSQLSQYISNHSQHQEYFYMWYKSPTIEMVHACVPSVHKHKTCMVSNHVCKLNAPHTCTYPYEVLATKRSSLQPVVP